MTSAQVAALKERGYAVLPGAVPPARREAALRAIDQAQQAGDTAALCRAAHKLRGAAANFGATRLQTLCMQLERDAHARRIGDALAAIPSVGEEVDNVLSALVIESRRPVTFIKPS